VDILGVHASRWAEDVVTGKRKIEVVRSLAIPMGERLVKLGQDWRPGANMEKTVRVECWA
jgi:hypothetical protein